MAKKHVCVSFDFEHDKYYYYLLKAWDSNPDIDFAITDCTPNEIQTESVAKVKQVLSTKIGEAKYMVALIGKHSDEEHPDHDEIGYKNWQAYEIDKNAEKGNGLVVVKLNSSYYAPDEAYGKGAEWVDSFNLDDIKDALNRLANKKYAYN
jgi:hypothetical protein